MRRIKGEVRKKARELLADICGAMVTKDGSFSHVDFPPALEAAIGARTLEPQTVWMGSLDKEVGRGLEETSRQARSNLSEVR